MVSWPYISFKQRRVSTGLSSTYSYTSSSDSKVNPVYFVLQSVYLYISYFVLQSVYLYISYFVLPSVYLYISYFVLPPVYLYISYSVLPSVYLCISFSSVFSKSRITLFFRLSNSMGPVALQHHTLPVSIVSKQHLKNTTLGCNTKHPCQDSVKTTPQKYNLRLQHQTTPPVSIVSKQPLKNTTWGCNTKQHPLSV